MALHNLNVNLQKQKRLFDERSTFSPVAALSVKVLFQLLPLLLFFKAAVIVLPQTTEQTQRGKALLCTTFCYSHPDNNINLIRVCLTAKDQPVDQKTATHYKPAQTLSGFLISQHPFSPSATQSYQCLRSCTQQSDIQKKNAM